MSRLKLYNQTYPFTLSMHLIYVTVIKIEFYSKNGSDRKVLQKDVAIHSKSNLIPVFEALKWIFSNQKFADQHKNWL